MSAHAIASADDTDGTVVVTCNAGDCDRRFTIASFSAAATRAAAADEGWRAARTGDRQDFCPDHAGGKP